MRCVTLVEREKESFQVTMKTVNRTRSGINEFQAAEPATEKARRPNIERQCRGASS